MKSLISIILVAAMLMFVAGCGDDGGSANTGTVSADWLLSDAPADAKPVAETLKSAKEGDAVTLIGRIGGRMKPISSDSGIFVIMDTAIPSCADMASDHCPTPWDYCCEKAETITNNAATIQLADAGGTAAFDSLKPLDKVTIVGTVAPRPSESALVVKATGVYVHKAAN